MNWRDLPKAPEPGAYICSLSELVVNHSVSVDLNGFPLLVIHNTAGIFAYFNACPHQYLALDWRSDRVLSETGDVLRCSNHQAGFDASTGEGIDGFAVGCSLTAIPLTIVENKLLVAEKGQ